MELEISVTFHSVRARKDDKIGLYNYKYQPVKLFGRA